MNMLLLMDKAFSWLDEHASQIASKLDRRFLLVTLLVLPVLLAVIFPLAFFGKSIFTFVPNSSDEIIYWREIKTFTDHGFSGGQYSTNEMPAGFAASPFGSHGPAFAILMA
jgi:hypothetical protein